MTPEQRHDKHLRARLKAVERKVGVLEAKLKPEQRRDYTRYLLACQRQNMVVTAQDRLEWLTEMSV